jgi:hypothetical protein
VADAAAAALKAFGGWAAIYRSFAWPLDTATQHAAALRAFAAGEGSAEDVAEAAAAACAAHGGKGNARHRGKKAKEASKRLAAAPAAPAKKSNWHSQPSRRAGKWTHWDDLDRLKFVFTGNDRMWTCFCGETGLNDIKRRTVTASVAWKHVSKHHPSRAVSHKPRGWKRS